MAGVQRDAVMRRLGHTTTVTIAAGRLSLTACRLSLTACRLPAR